MIIKQLEEFCVLINKQARPIMGVDYGVKKCGIAISNPELTIALPLLVINLINLQDKINILAKLVNQYNILGIVIGLPLNMDGTHSTQTEHAMKFATNIAQKLQLPIYMQDERLTSRAADNLLKSTGLKRKIRNQKDDAVAASLILETVLNSRNLLKDR